MGRRLVIIRPSARKHGIADDDIRAALATPLLSGPLDDDHPQRILTLGVTFTFVWRDFAGSFGGVR